MPDVAQIQDEPADLFSPPRVVIVLGMHRSGTSALAGAFSELGFNLGDELLPANAQANAKGYFEHAQVVRLHEELLAAFGMDWQDLRPLPESWERHPAAEQARARIRNLLRALVSDGAIGVIKDPRMCRFLPLWLDLMQELGVEAHFAFIARHPVEVAASLRRRDGLSEYRSGLLTLVHQLEAERATRGQSRLFLSYEDLVADWREQMGRCYRAFGLGAVPVTGEHADAVDGFLDPELRHHRSGEEDALDPMVMEAYAEIRRSVLTDDANAIAAPFDRLRPSLEAARRSHVGLMEAALDAITLNHRQEDGGERALGIAWDSVPFDAPEGLRPMAYVRDAGGEFSEGNALSGHAVLHAPGVYSVSFEVASKMPLRRFRFDPDVKPGVYGIVEIVVDGLPVPDPQTRMVAMSGPAVRLTGGLEWATASDDPWIEFDLSQVASVRTRPVRIDVRFRRLTAAGVAEEAAALRHAQQGGQLQALAQQSDGIARSVQHSREIHQAEMSARFDGLWSLTEGVSAAVQHSRELHDAHIERRVAALDSSLRHGHSALDLAIRQQGESQRNQQVLEYQSIRQERMADHLALSGQVGALGQQLEALGRQVDVLGRQVEVLGRQVEVLAGSVDPLVGQLASVSGAVMELKHRSDRPLLHRLRGRWRAYRGRARLKRGGKAWNVHFEPLANVVIAGEGWNGTLRDPQFSLSLDEGSEGGGWISGGWQRLVVEAHCTDGMLVNPCLYPDYGQGTSELDRIDLPEFDKDGRIEVMFHFRSDVRMLRFDPTSQDARFTIRAALRPISRPRALVEMVRHIQRVGESNGAPSKGLLSEAIGHLLAGGPKRMRKAIHERYAAILRATGSDYASWRARFEPVLRAGDAERRYAEMPAHPKLSVVMPVYQPPERWLRRALDSVVDQAYPDWELCISDDASPSPHVRRVLDEYVARDPRIKVAYRAKNGHISESSNSALELAAGDYVVLLDHDDELHPEALLLVAEAVAANPDLKVVYSDEDKIDEAGNRYDPYFKPDWNYDLLLGQNCLSHLGVYALPLVREVGGFRKGYEGSQDWDLALRCIERLKPGQIHHIPRVLYHWRAIQGSTALGVDQKSYTVVAGQKAVRSHLERMGVDAEVDFGAMNVLRVRRPLPEPAPRVSLIIPTRDRVELLRVCVDSILERSTYPDYEILVVDNGSVEPATLAYFDELSRRANVRVLPYPHPFNYSAINNFAAAQATGQILGLVNNDIEVITPSWIEEMVVHAARPDVGAVGAMLYYPDDTIQHAGVLVGVGGVAAHVGSHQGRGSPGYFSRQLIAHQLSAVTAACLLVRRSVFEEVGGLDEGLKVAFNDIDFCLRLQEQGYRNVWTPWAELYHHESASRGLEDNPEKMARFMSEIEFMQRRWGAALRRDPSYNPNLSLTHPFMLSRDVVH